MTLQTINCASGAVVASYEETSAEAASSMKPSTRAIVIGCVVPQFDQIIVARGA